MIWRNLLLLVLFGQCLSAQPPIRVHVPVYELPAVRVKHPKAVLLNAEEYRQLQAAAKDVDPEQSNPRAAAIGNAQYTATFADDQLRVTGNMEFASLAKDPIDLILPIDRISFDQFELSENPAPLWVGDNGRLNIRLPGKGTHNVKVAGIIPLEDTPGGGTRFHFRIPGAVSGVFKLQVPGDQEIRTNVPVLWTEFDEAASLTTISLAIGGHEHIHGVLLGNGHREDQRTILIGNSASTVTLDPAGQVLDVFYTIQVLRQGVRKFAFQLDSGWTVTEVSSPDLVSWSATPGEEGVQQLEIHLHNSSTGTKTLQFKAHAESAGLNWSAPRLRLQDADYQRGFLLVDPGNAKTFRAETLRETRRQDLSSSTNVQGLTSSNGRLYFHWGENWGLDLIYAPVLLERHSEEQQLLITSPSGLLVEGEFDVTAVGHEMAHLLFTLPPRNLGWELEKVLLHDKSGGFEYRLRDLPDGQELRIDLKKSVQAEGLAKINLSLRNVPGDWNTYLAESATDDVSNRTFPLIGLDAIKTKGVVAFASRGHLEVDTNEVPESWSTINVGQLGALGLGNEVRSAYRYTEPLKGLVDVSIRRAEARINGNSIGLYTMEKGSVRGDFRIHLVVSRAPTRQFYVLAEKSIGEDISFNVLNHRLSSSNIVEPSPDTLELTEEQTERYNLWQLQIDEAAQGALNILAQFRQVLDGSSHELPLLRLAGADQLVEYVAIQAGEEFAVEIEATGTREVDPIDLPDLPMQARRILSVHRLLPQAEQGEAIRFTLSSETLDSYAIPSVLILESALKTQVGVRGSQQTMAMWKIANVSQQFLEVQLPETAELWSAQVSGNPVKPKVGNEGLLRLPLPLSREPVQVSVVYFSPGGNGTLSGLQLLPPKLPGIPVNETRWEVFPPRGNHLADFESNLTTSTKPASRPTPALLEIVGGATLGAAADHYPQEDAAAEGISDPWGDANLRRARPEAPMDSEEPMPASAKPQIMDEAEKIVADIPVSTMAATEQAKPQKKQKYSGDDQFKGGKMYSGTRVRGRYTLPVNIVVAGHGKEFYGLGNPELNVTFGKSFWAELSDLGVLLGLCITILAFCLLPKGKKLLFFLIAGIVTTLAVLWIPQYAELWNGYFYGTLICGILWPIGLLAWWILKWIWKWLSKTLLVRVLIRQFYRIAWGMVILSLCNSDWQSLRGQSTIFIPYGEEGPAAEGQESRVLLPYNDFQKLWNQAYPDEPLVVKRKAPRIFLRKPVFQGKLVNEETFELVLRVNVEVDSSGNMDMPLAFGNVAIEECLWNGAAASVTARKEGGILLHLENGSQGVLEVRAVAKPEIKGRSGSVALKLPPLPAADMKVNLLDPELELTTVGTQSNPVRKDEAWEFPVGRIQDLTLRWRPQVGAGSADRTLTASSSHQVHVFHWGIIGVSSINYRFSGGEHDRFHVLLPGGSNVSELETANLRDHRLVNELELDGKTFQALEVRLHRAVKKQHQLTLRWMAPFPPEAVPGRLWLPRAGEVGRESGRVELHSALGVGVKTVSVDGGRRINRSSQGVAQSTADGSSFNGSYEWPFRPFRLNWEVKREAIRVKNTLQQLVRVSTEDVQLLGNISVKAEEGLIFGSTFLLPVGYEVLNVVGADVERWHIQEEGMGNLLHVDYRVARLETSLAVVLVNESPELETFTAPSLRATTPAGQLLEEQSGQVAIQVAPALEARTLESTNLRPRPRSAVASWLGGKDQIHAVQFAYDSEGPDAVLQLGILKRPTEVRLDMIAGVLVEETVANFTYRLRYHVEGSSLDRISFTLPESVAKDVAVFSPALRGIQHESLEGDLHQWEVSLVNEVTGLVDIGVNFSVPIAPETKQLSIPELKTDASSGYRTVIAIQNESRHQLEFQASAGMRAATLEEQREVIDESLRKSLQFVYHTFQPNWNAALGITYAQETKRLEAVIDLMTLRTFVSKSGRSVYEVKLSLQNRAEQFIVLEVPENLRLWSAQVDKQPVKPVFPEGAEKNQVGIPLVKTTVAGLPFDAKLFLAGTLEDEVKPGKRIEPPAIKVVNIPVKRTNWTLHLPEEFDYFDLEGNMDPVSGSRELLALGIDAKIDQLRRLSKASKRYKGKKGKGYEEFQSGLSKELGLLEQQFDANYKGYDQGGRSGNNEEDEILQQQYSQQKAALQTLNAELQGENNADRDEAVIVNGFLNASTVNPGTSEWDRNGALNILPGFVSQAQRMQVANLNIDIQNNSILLQQSENQGQQIALNPAQIPSQPISQQRAQVFVTQSGEDPGQITAAPQTATGLLGGAQVEQQTDDILLNNVDVYFDAAVSQREAPIISGNEIAMQREGRLKQITTRQDVLNEQLGNLADNRLNRFFSNKGRNTANARSHAGKFSKSGQKRNLPAGIPPGASPFGLGTQPPPQSLPTETPDVTSLHFSDNTAAFTAPEAEDTVFTFATGDFPYNDIDGDGVDKIRLQAATAGTLWVDTDQDALALNTGTYSLDIQFPEKGRRFDFSYPGDDPVVSLRIRDNETQNRNYATIGLLALLGVIVGVTRYFPRKKAS